MTKTQKFDWTETIKINIISLKIAGLWPPGDEIYGFTLYSIYEAIVLVFFQCGYILTQTIELFLILNDVDAVSALIFVLLMEMSGISKSYAMIKNMKMLKQLMKTLNSDIFQPKNEHQLDLVLPYLDAWKKISGSFSFFAVIWWLLYGVFPFFDKSDQFRLPSAAWIPYNYKISPNYELTYIYQFISFSYLSVVNVAMDAFLAALNMYIGAHIDILCDNLKNFCKSGEVEQAESNLRKCIQQHREILKFVDDSNLFYNTLIFLQLFVAAVSIGMSMFQLTLVPPFSGKFYSFISYAIAISNQTLLYCWFGNEIQYKSDKLAYALFESDWTDLPIDLKKKIIIFVFKLSKSIKVSAFGLFDLSLETFVKIHKTAYSYFALLRQVNTPQ